jgi:hypothetical protein
MEDEDDESPDDAALEANDDLDKPKTNGVQHDDDIDGH